MSAHEGSASQAAWEAQRKSQEAQQLGQQPIYPNVQPHTTAYEREQQALRTNVAQHGGRLDVHEGRIDDLAARVDALEGAFASGAPMKPLLTTNGDKFYTLEAAAVHLRTAREIIAQCVALKFFWASFLDELDVARWMADNPSECCGAFDLERLKKSIRL